MRRTGFFAVLTTIFLALTSISFAATPTANIPKVGLSSDLIYFVMPDRYKDGDPSNDRLGGGFDPRNTAFWHGGDLKGLTGTCQPGDDGLARIKSLGFTAVWVTPLVTQVPSTGAGAGYHGYWGVDFLNVDPHLGTNADLSNFMTCAKKLNLKIILDIVANHTGDVIKYNGQEAYIPASMATIKNPAWLNDLSNYHNVGDMAHCWGDGDCTKIGDFYGLDDLATEKETVWRGWADVYGQWIKNYGFAGFRVDTAKHVDDQFFKNWQPLIQQTAAAAGIPNFTIFGEVSEANAFNLMPYVRENKIQTVLDFPFQESAIEYASGYSDSSKLRELFLADDYYTSPTSSASNLVTYLGNHDAGRAGFLISAKRINPAKQLLPRVELGYALLYLSRGIPAVYYGDEVGMTGTGGDQLARQDMFSTKVDIWRTEPRIGGKPIGYGNSFSATASNPIAKYLKVLAQLRKSNPGLANGFMQPRLAKGPLYVVSKKDGAENREYLVAFNNSDKAVTTVITTATSTGGWKTILGSTKPVATGAKVKFTIPALSAVVLKANKVINQVSVKVGTITTSQDDFTGYYQVSAGVKTSDLASVEFFSRQAGATNWDSLGVDTNSPYSVYLNPNDYLGQDLELKAIVTNSKGATFELPSTKLSIPAS
ncbi:MAG TPA: alpha-amylase family glycosyl hydrolase [Candidatus Nanopelagicaceae bacterium]